MSSGIPNGWDLRLAENFFVRQKVKVTHDKRRVKQRGSYPVIDQSETGEIGFIDDYPEFDCSKQNPIVTFANHTCAVRKMTKPFGVIQNVFPLVAHSDTDIDFVFQALLVAIEPEGYKGHYPKLRETEFLTPPLPEQKKIASILTSVDEVIENTQKQIDKLQDLKKATMNELLTKGIGHTEFKDSELGRIPKSWRVESVARCMSSMASGWSPDCLAEPASGSRWGVLKTTAVTWDGFAIHENKALPPDLQGRPEITLVEGDVLVTRAGPIDRVGVIAFCDETYPNIMLSDKIIRVQTKRDELIGEFLSIWLSSDWAQRSMRVKISGMAEAQSNISQEILKGLVLPLPELNEQEKIAGVLREFSIRIQNTREKLRIATSLKRALMQDLLTGKVRVSVD